jgi:hypothetical protein
MSKVSCSLIYKATFMPATRYIMLIGMKTPRLDRVHTALLPWLKVLKVRVRVCVKVMVWVRVRVRVRVRVCVRVRVRVRVCVRVRVRVGVK